MTIDANMDKVVFYLSIVGVDLGNVVVELSNVIVVVPNCGYDIYVYTTTLDLTLD